MNNKLAGPQKLIDALLAQELDAPEEQIIPKVEDKDPRRPRSSPYQYSLYLLSGQDYSEYKLRQKLKAKGYEAPEIDEAVTKLIEKNYLREEEYKKLLVRRLMRKGKADGLIRRQVEQEQLKVSAEELAECREDTGMSKDETIAQLVQKKLRGKSWPLDRTERQKLQEKVYRYLLSRGFSYDDAKKAVKATQD